MRWESVPDRTYSLERATNLGLVGAFGVVVSNLPGQAGIMVYTDTNPPAGDALFYRVGVTR